tara:strand:- start:2536 stop:3135 length:600 start_codon:yes stop_codon:yes gene_type:complete
MKVGVCPAYLPSVNYMAWIVAQKEIGFIISKHFQKQTFRNRTEIYGPNGKLNLIIPIVHRKDLDHQLDKNVLIHQENSWQKNHWRSLETSYRSSPFYEYYEHDLYPFFHTRQENLMDLNIQLILKILSLLRVDKDIIKEEEVTNEFRVLILAKQKVIKSNPIYSQVFASKHGYLDNLSILDLLFNLGPESIDYLIKLDI